MASDRMADMMRAGFDRRYRAAAVHTVAAQEGLSAAQAGELLDDAEFGERLDRLDVGAAAFTSQVRDLVRSAEAQVLLDHAETRLAATREQPAAPQGRSADVWWL